MSQERKEMNALLHFDEDELEFFERHGFLKMCGVVFARFVLWMVGTVSGVLYIYFTVGTPLFYTVMSIGSIFITILCALMVWEMLRLSSLLAHKEELEEYRETVSSK